MYTRLHEATFKMYCRLFSTAMRSHCFIWNILSSSACFLCSFLSPWLLKDVKQGRRRKKKKVGCSRSFKKKSLEESRDPFLPLCESYERIGSQTGPDVETGKKNDDMKRQKAM